MSSSSSQLFSLGHFNLERQTAATFSSSQVEIYKLTEQVHVTDE